MGFDNCRVNDLKHMLGFTHTGLIGELINFQNFNIILLLYLEDV